MKLKGVLSKYCLKCAAINKRSFLRICEICSFEFKDKNNKRKYCDGCDLKINPCLCELCGINITRRAKKCNRCVALTRTQRGGWRRYEHNGINYRSKWELAVVDVFEKCSVDFEYEKFDQETKTRPDFYISKLGRYLEIHPDYHGKKRIPENAIIVKTLSHSRATALAIALRVNPDTTHNYLKTLPNRALRGQLRISISAACYIRQLIEERNLNEN